MELPLSDSEAGLLRQALNLHLSQMRGEYVHTDTRTYREELRKDLDMLEMLALRLDGLIAGKAAH